MSPIPGAQPHVDADRRAARRVVARLARAAGRRAGAVMVPAPRGAGHARRPRAAEMQRQVQVERRRAAISLTRPLPSLQTQQPGRPAAVLSEHNT